MKIRVAVAGAKGKMGQEVVDAVSAQNDMEVVAQIEAGDDLAAILTETKPDALVDFTIPSAVARNIETALKHGVSPIVGTTGLSADQIAQIRAQCAQTGVGALIAPNFALGAVLLMRFAQEAARYLPDVEIIEMHHEQKLDAPSGTALKTAEMIAVGRSDLSPTMLPGDAYEKLPGARGGAGAGEIRIHSVRLPGFVASEEVIFGAAGQTLTIKHDSRDRKCFMPGVLLALRHIPVMARSGTLIYGLEGLL